MIQFYIMRSIVYKRKTLTKIFLAAALIAAVAFALFSLRETCAKANAETVSNVFAPPSKEQTQTVYNYFEDPTAMSADGEYLYLLDNGKVKRFSISDYSRDENYELSESETVTAFSVIGGIVVTVENGNVYIYNNPSSRNELLNDETYIAVYIDETHVYAQTNNNTIRKKSRVETAEPQTYSYNQIKKFTVLKGEIYFSTNHSSSRRDDIMYFQSDGTAYPAVENVLSVIDMYAAGETLVVADSKDISVYSRGIYELIRENSTETITDTVAVTVSRNGAVVYLLDADKAVTQYLKNLENGVCVTASVSSEPGFFSSPTDVVTRRNRTYIVDRNNNRIVIHDGEKYSALSEGLFRPIAVTVDHAGNLYAAYSENKIAVFDSQEKRTTDPQSETISVVDADGKAKRIAIADIKCDAKANLYLLTRDNSLFVCKVGTDDFVPVDGVAGNITLLDVSPNSSYVYFAQSENNGNKTTVKRIGANGIETVLSDLSHVVDFAVDADNSLYVLFSGERIVRYDNASKESKAEVINDCTSLSRITVSNVYHEGVIGYRDVIVTETVRHTIRIVSCSLFGVEASIDKIDPAIDSALSSAPTQATDAAKLIRTITKDGAEVFAQSSEITLITTLPIGFKVIVPAYNENAAYSLVIADKVVFGTSTISAEPWAGYVNNEFLSDPLPYSSEHETDCTAWISDVPIYKYPSRQAPKIEEASQGTTLKLLDFVSEKSLYGYIDNFITNDEYRNAHRWYRVSFERDDKQYEGFVIANSVSVLLGNPDLSVHPQVNAKIIAKDKKYPTVGATVYFIDENGEYVADPRFQPIAVGTGVEVIGAFDSSKPYTQIAFYTSNGTVKAYVETANLKYQGVNVVGIVAIVILIITVILLILLCTKIYIKRHNKKEE